MIILRILLLSFCFSFFAFSYAVDGTRQNPYEIYMVLWRGETDVEKGFLDYFKRRGIEVKATIRNFDRDTSKAEGFIAEARRLQPDLIYTWGTGGTLAIRGRHDLAEAEKAKFLTSIPGIFTLVAYPKEAGIVPDFERTKRNLTGVSFLAPVEAQLGAINAYLAPEQKLERLGIIYNPLERNARINSELLINYAKENNIELLIEPMPIITVNEEGRIYDKPDTDALPDIVSRLHGGNAQFIYIGADSYMTRKVKELSEAAVTYGIPIFAATEAPIKDADSSVLISLTTVYYNLGQLTAYQAEQMLVNKTPPQRVPVRSLSEYNILLNRKAMRELKYFPPIELLLDAQFVDSSENEEG